MKTKQFESPKDKDLFLNNNIFSSIIYWFNLNLWFVTQMYCMCSLTKSIKQFIENKEYEKALEKLNNILVDDSENIEYLILRGDIFHLQQKFSKALNDYNRVLKLNPENKFLSSKTEMIKDILKFQALDIFESTNLNMDPWLDD